MHYSDEEIRSSYKIEPLEGVIYQVSFLRPILDIDDDIKMAQFINEEFGEILARNAGKNFRILVDFSALGRENKVTPKARRIYENLLSDPRVEKIAVISLNSYTTVMMNFIVFAARISSKLKIFSGQKAALEWLKK